MSEPETKSETTRQRTIRLLKILETNSDKFLVFPENNPPADLLTLNDLLKDDFISGIMCPNGSGFPIRFMQTRITPKGIEYLEKLEHKENNLPAQIASNKPAESEEKKKAQNQLPPPNRNDGTKSEPFFDNVFKLLAGIAFVSWMIQEYVLPHNKFFLFLAIVCGLADVFYLFVHKILPNNLFLIVLSWAMYLVCIWLIYRNPTEINPAAPNSIAPPVVTLSTADGIMDADFSSNDVVNGDQKFLRLQTLFIGNPNNAPLLNLSCQIQFPEAIVYTYPIERSPGTEVLWHRREEKPVLHGATAIHSPVRGIDSVSRFYVLEIDKVAASKGVKIDFLTSTRPELTFFYYTFGDDEQNPHKPNQQTGLFDSDTSSFSPCYYFLSGNYQHDSPTGTVSEDFFAAMIEKTNREIYLSPVQKGSGDRFLVRIQGGM
jgi:hypothetical protein